MCAPFGAQLYLLDCFTPFAMTVVLESLSLRASAATRGNPVYFMLRVARKFFIAAEHQRRRVNFELYYFKIALCHIFRIIAVC